MVSEYGRSISSLVYLFGDFPVIATGPVADVLLGNPTDAQGVHFSTVIDLPMRVTNYVRRGKHLLQTMVIKPYREEELPNLAQRVSEELGDDLPMVALNLCSPELLDVLRRLGDNSKVYSDVQDLGLADMVRQLRINRLSLMNESFPRIARRFAFTTEGYGFYQSRGTDVTYEQAVSIALGKYAPLSKEEEVSVIGELCKKTYLPEELEEYRAGLQAVEMLAQTGRESIPAGLLLMFRRVAGGIGYRKGEESLNRKVKDMWNPRVNALQLRELEEFVSEDPTLDGVLKNLEKSFVPGA